MLLVNHKTPLNLISMAVFLVVTVLSCVTVIMPAMAQEDVSVRQGDYEVFYSVFNSSFLQPETAVAIGVKRAKNIALINLSIREYMPDGSTQASKADVVEATAFNLVHKNNLEFQEIVEPGAVYYLAEFKISNDNEMIVIKASVTPANSRDVIDIKFEHRFYLN